MEKATPPAVLRNRLVRPSVLEADHCPPLRNSTGSGSSHRLRSPIALIGVFCLLVAGWLVGCGGGGTTDTAGDPPSQEGSGEAGEGAQTAEPAEAAAEPFVPETVAEGAAPGPRDDGLPCAPGTRCVRVDRDGSPNPEGDNVAQCSGTFPDYVTAASMFPAGYGGPWFVGAFDFPQEKPSDADLPWTEIDFTAGVEGADAYLMALRDYSYEGNLEVGFRVQANPVRPWYVIPYMNFGNGRRDPIHGVTKERTVRGPELGVREGAEIENYGIGFYNDLGGFGVGRVWAHPLKPDLSATRFENGTMVFKILFTDAVPEDFEDPSAYPLEGAPEWQIATGDGELTTVRLLQMDVAARDPRAQPSEWVFGTFAYDRDAPDENPWRRMRPVGLSWGNAPGYTPADQAAGTPLPENTVSPQAPAYAAAHLGWAGRVNGPVDNPISSCHSCHGVAQFPVDAAMAPFLRSCDSDDKRLHWFRNLPSGQSFGAVDRDTCLPETVDPPPTDLDFSMQIKVSLQSILQFRNDNPCLEADPGPVPQSIEDHLPRRIPDAPEVGRDGFVAEGD
ncbi:MAG: hypothetical protein MI919_27505 [Holophagales bacterium]|nr:hypothetical protein [Holophagales bacterium]